MALAFLLLAPALGCEPKSVTLAIPGFGAGDVNGVWLWRLSETSGKYERACRLEIGSPKVAKSGKEVVSYTQVCAAPGQAGMDMTAEISRLSTDPSTIIVKLFYFRYANPGQFRASSYNSAGESPLSADAIAL